MEPDRHVPDPDRLRDAWDRFVRGEDDLRDLDAGDRVVVRRLHALHRPPGAAPAFVTRLEEEIMNSAVVPAHTQRRYVPSSLNGRASTAFPPRRAARTLLPVPRFISHIALAAMVALIVVGSYLAWWPQDSAPRRGSQVPAALSSPVATPTTDAQAAESVLITQFDTAWLPSGLSTTFLVRVVIDPGVRTTRQPGDFPSGARIDYVVAGSYTVRSEGPLTVMRGNGADTPASEIPPGTEVALAAGDAVIHQDNAAGQIFGNPGTEPTVVMFAGILKSSLPSPPTGMVAGTPAERVETLEGPVAVELRRSEIEPGGTLAGPEADAVQLVIGEPGPAGSVSLAERSDGSVRNLEQDPVSVWILLVTPASSATPVA